MIGVFAMFLGGVSFQSSIGLGSGIVSIVVVIAAGYFAIKNKALESANEQSTQWREGYLAERTRREDVEAELARQRELKHAALTENAALRMATDLTVVTKELAQLKIDLLGRMTDAEARIADQLAKFSETQATQTEGLKEIARIVDRVVQRLGDDAPR